MSNLEEIENRVNQTKNIFHKCALEGKIDIGLMLRDFDYLINENSENFNVIIRLLPEKFLELIKEANENKVYFERNIEAECFFIELLGRKTPVIIDNDLPENTEFIIQSQKDYEREEHEKQLKKFFKMFGD